MALSETIRGEGASTASMTGMILSVVVNISAGSHLYLALKMNVMGAALATVIAKWGSGGLLHLVHPGKEQGASIRIQRFPPEQEILSNIFKIGSAAFLFSALAIISSTMFNAYAMHYGEQM